MAEAKTRFGSGEHRYPTATEPSRWVLSARDGDPIDATALVGEVVNIGTKDGAVYDSVTVASFDDHTGHLSVSGGRIGWPYFDRAPEPVAEAEVWLYEIARGYVHEQCAVVPLEDGQHG